LRGEGDIRTHFAITMARGSSYSDSVTISNLGAGELVLNIYPADGATTPQGAFTAEPASEVAKDAATWITTEFSEVTVPPGEAVAVPFDIVVPSDAVPGDHAAAIIASRLVEALDENGARIAVDQRVGARVYLRVSGDMAPELTVSNLKVDYGAALFPFENKPAKVTFTVTNSGNITLAATGTLSAVGPFGLHLGKPGSLSYEMLLPGASVDGELQLDGLYPLGPISFEMSAEGTPLSEFAAVTVPPEVAKVRVWAIPWLALSVVLLLLGIWIWRRIVWRRRKRAWKEQAQPERAPKHAKPKGGEASPTPEGETSAPEPDAPESEPDAGGGPPTPDPDEQGPADGAKEGVESDAGELPESGPDGPDPVEAASGAPEPDEPDDAETAAPEPEDAESPERESDAAEPITEAPDSPGTEDTAPIPAEPDDAGTASAEPDDSEPPRTESDGASPDPAEEESEAEEAEGVERDGAETADAGPDAGGPAEPEPAAADPAAPEDAKPETDGTEEDDQPNK
jgi:hypothetical protein